MFCACVFAGYLFLEDETPFSPGHTNAFYENKHYDIFKPSYFSSTDGHLAESNLLNFYAN